MNRHAYLIIAHNEPEVLTALLHALDVEWNDIYLHIDKRRTSLRTAMGRMRLDRARLFVIPNPIAVYWGHTSQIAAELLLMKRAMAHGPYAYYHLLSGCDMPVKTAQNIYRFFESHQGQEFVGFWNGEKHERDARRKVRYYYVLNRFKRRSARMPHLLTSPFRNLFLMMQKMMGINRIKGTVRKGFQWFSITEDCCRYVLEREAEIWSLFRYTLCCDELFMQTMVWNSPFRERLFDTEDAQRGSMRAIDWERGEPYVWRKDDISDLIHSPYLFARKFSSTEMDAVECLTKYLEEHRPSSSPHPATSEKGG